MKLLVEQVDIVETLTPMSFSSFRDRLDTASGFQSVQFREMEFLLGYKRKDMLRFHATGSDAEQRLNKRLNEPTINDALFAFVKHHGGDIPDEVLNRDVSLRVEGNEKVQDAIFKLYSTRPDMEILFELMTDFDEGFQEWRYRHIKLVERTIGASKARAGRSASSF